MKEIELNNKTYLFKEIPNTNNINILKFTVYLQFLYNICRKLLLSIIQRNTNVKTTIGFVVSVIDKISENLISIILLSSKGFATNTAIILVNLIELRTDLKYISKKPNKIEDWFKHQKKYTKPWQFKNQIKEISSNDEEIKLERAIYEICSIAKHGNPAGIDIGFNIGLKDEEIFINLDRQYRLTDYLYWTYVYTSDSIKSSLEIVDKFKIDIPNIEEELEKLSKDINLLYNEILTQKVRDYIYQKNPELKNIDNELERLKSEKSRVESEIKAIEKQIRKI
jgi:hypothetical protein